MQSFFLFTGLLLSGCVEYIIEIPADPVNDPPKGDTSPVDDTALPTETDTDSKVDTGKPVIGFACDDQVLPSLALPVDESCLEITGTNTTGDMAFSVLYENTFYAQVEATPVVANLTDDDGDGDVDEYDIPDIVSVDLGTNVWVTSGEDGRVLWEWTSQGGDGWPGACAIGQLDGVGAPEIVCPAHDAIKAFYADGRDFWTNVDFTQTELPIYSAAGIYDLEADGTPEVVIGCLILDGQTGLTRGMGQYGCGTGLGWGSQGGAHGVAADLDGDGIQEVVTGNAAYDADGQTLWYNGLTDGFVGVADMDLDGELDVVVVAEHEVRIQDAWGNVVAQASDYDGTANDADAYAPPALADLDADGYPEIVVGAYEDGVTWGIDHDLTLMWRGPSNYYYGGSVIYDLEGDGFPEVITTSWDHIAVLDGMTGVARIWDGDATVESRVSSPVVADVDGDGQANIIVGLCPMKGYNPASHWGLKVLGPGATPWSAARPVWNQSGYAAYNVEDDASIPSRPDPRENNGFRTTPGVDVAILHPDAMPYTDTCLDDCGSGWIRLWVRVANGGRGTLAAGVEVQVYAVEGNTETLLDTGLTADEVHQGLASGAITFNLPANAIPEGRVRVQVVGVTEECNTANDTIEVSGLSCP